MVLKNCIPSSAADITLPRSKPRAWVFSLACRAKALTILILGPNYLLRFCLNTSWLFKRFAWELTGEVFGDSFYEAAMGLSAEILQQFIPRGSSVIDIGCGTGRLCRFVANYADQVVGIDFNQSSIEIAKDLSNEEKIKYFCGDITQVLEIECGFDVALLSHVLEHIEDPESLLISISKIASTLLVEVPDFEEDSLNIVRRELNCPYYSDADHVREYTLPILVDQIKKSGWILEYCERKKGSIVVFAVGSKNYHDTSQIKSDKNMPAEISIRPNEPAIF
jgi:SAM-dependent methyltransferase